MSSDGGASRDPEAGGIREGGTRHLRSSPARIASCPGGRRRRSARRPRGQKGSSGEWRNLPQDLPGDKGRGGAFAGRGAWGCDGARWRGEEMRDPLPHWDKGSLPDSGALWAPPDGLPQACRAEDDDKAPAHRDGGGEAGDGRREAQVRTVCGCGPREQAAGNEAAGPGISGRAESAWHRVRSRLWRAVFRADEGSSECPAASRSMRGLRDWRRERDGIVTQADTEADADEDAEAEEG